jgi:murein DD-endopeptidase MepM/ murein hydrolase activator NlpD
MIPIGGRINGSERYAVDWVRFDLNARPLVDVQKGLEATSAGDRTRNESYLAYDQPLLAVADATVVSVVTDQPEATPQTLPTGLRLDQYGGNQVTLDLGSGGNALYAHMKPDSATVRPGDRVTKGQEIGRLGNSGNTSEPHLHFHVMTSPQPLTADNVPFVIDRFDYVGVVTPDGLVANPPAGPRTDELPLAESTANYPRR